MSRQAPDLNPERIPYSEYVLRLLYASFYPAVKLAVDLNYPLDTVKDMMTLALWQEAKRKHSTINLISLIFGKSTRTVKALSARFNKGGFFNQTETNLMRRVEDLLRQQPMTLDELAQRLPHSNEFDSSRLAVDALLREGRIEEVAARPGSRSKYQIINEHHDLFSDSHWEGRIDALYEHLEVVTETIRKRFLTDAPDDAVARTFSFRASRKDMEAFSEELLAFIRERAAQMEKNAADLPDAETFSFYTGSTSMEDK